MLLLYLFWFYIWSPKAWKHFLYSLSGKLIIRVRVTFDIEYISPLSFQFRIRHRNSSRHFVVETRRLNTYFRCKNYLFRNIYLTIIVLFFIFNISLIYVRLIICWILLDIINNSFRNNYFLIYSSNWSLELSLVRIMNF